MNNIPASLAADITTAILDLSIRTEKNRDKIGRYVLTACAELAKR